MSAGLSRLLGRWRVALRYGRRDARRNKGRTTLVASMVALTVGAGVFLASAIYAQADTPERRVEQALGPRLQASITAAAGPVLQDPRGNAAPAGDDGLGTEPEPVPLTEFEDTVSRSLPADDTRLLSLRHGVRLHHGGRVRDIEVMQSDLEVPELAAALPLAAGTLPDDGEIALDADVAAELGLTVGDSVDVEHPSADGASRETATVTVAGLIRDTPFWYGEAIVPADGLLSAPETSVANGPLVPQVTWFVAGGQPVTWHDVLELNDVGAVVTSRDVLLDPPSTDAVPYYDVYAEAVAADRTDLVRSWSAVGAVAAVALLEAVLLIGPAFAVGTRRSARSLALIAASGGSRRTLRAVVLSTGVVVGLGGSLLGAALGLAGVLVLAATTTGSLAGVVVPWWIVAAMIAVGTLIATMAAWLPARGAAKTDMVAVLGGRRTEAAARRWPAAVGTALGAVAFGGALVAGIAAMPLLVAAGVVVGEIGLVLACGGIVALLGRLARHLPLTWRFALRDAARHRGRTAPALAAVLVAVAGASGGLVYSTAMSHFDERSQALTAAPGALVVAASQGDADPTLAPADADRVADLMRDVVGPDTEILEISVLRSGEPGIDLSVWPESPPDHHIGGITHGGGAVPGPVVDGGALAELLGLPDPAAARAALADGRAVVQAGEVGDDGTAHLMLHRWDTEAGQELTGDTLEVPAIGLGDPLGPSNTNYPVLPPSLVAELGATTAVGGLIAMPGEPLSRTDRDTLQAELDAAFPGAEIGWCSVCAEVATGVEEYGTPQWITSLAIIVSTGLLALAAAWIAAALAATEARPDLATLAAVGAPPRLRKRIVAAQAGTVAAIGSVLGALSGIALGAAFVLLRRHEQGTSDIRWTVEVPWATLGATVVGLVVVAVVVAWLVTRSREVITRRLAT
ncbi:FtsX-like permease family protein [Isoptericola croceus]|uniref:FtsX-like permease family protein n=1 Tax=Isoptericola croceus TaxID=3031406 RepID=UPI0023F9D76D|nr:FtsX-like permease family protein [Isoptericola croceus]